jgi:phosphatidylserine/phosphatidylglycerophosphate/cardiolipin synthase-like enzyme
VTFVQPPGVGAIQPYLLTQCDIEVEAKPLEEQPHQDRIEAQSLHVADAFAGFVRDATRTIDVCIYDFRLDLERVRTTVVDAINGAADGGVTVRIAYDKAQETEDGPILKQFRIAGGDPAPVGTEHFLRARAELHPDVQVRGVTEEAIDPGGQIMHHKYIVRDRDDQAAAIWMGSANFTVDAWALQENNILVVSDCPDLAAAYGHDFDELWASQKITGTGVGDRGIAHAGGQAISYAFAPGEGKAIEALIADTISRAKTRLRVASMVTSSQRILAALRAQIDAAADFAGVYDRGETANVRSTWARNGQAEKVALLDAVTAAMVAKPSLAYSPQYAHNFMHDKVVVADDTVVTGSFNFSLNATRNAENVLVIENAALADLFATSIDQVVVRYR